MFSGVLVYVTKGKKSNVDEQREGDISILLEHHAWELTGIYEIVCFSLAKVDTN